MFFIYLLVSNMRSCTSRGTKGKGKGKGAQSIEMSEGVGNPVYDSFDDGRPLEDVRVVCYFGFHFFCASSFSLLLFFISSVYL